MHMCVCVLCVYVCVVINIKSKEMRQKSGIVVTFGVTGMDQEWIKEGNLYW